MLKLKHYIEFYFKPKAIEHFGNKTIYDLLGIRFFKRYLPTTGDVMRQFRKLKQIKPTNSNRLNELYRYEKQTREYEWRHLLGIVLFIALTFLIDRKLTGFDWVILPILNLFINVYPIFLQRYNRIRILKLLKRYGYPSPYIT